MQSFPQVCQDRRFAFLKENLHNSQKRLSCHNTNTDRAMFQWLLNRRCTYHFLKVLLVVTVFLLGVAYAKIWNETLLALCFLNIEREVSMWQWLQSVSPALTVNSRSHFSWLFWGICPFIFKSFLYTSVPNFLHCMNFIENGWWWLLETSRLDVFQRYLMADRIT